MKDRITSDKEKLLNPVVGRFNFTSQHRVGTVTELILQKEFKDMDEWEKFYYESGKERLNKEEIEKDSRKLTQIRKGHGRTEQELEEIGKELYEKVKKFGQITEKDCKNCIKQYVIDNTWEGVMEREKNTIEKLKSLGIENIQKTSGEVDATHAVDYEIIINSKKIGIQIKPPSYLGHDKGNIRQQNEDKQKKYPGKVFTIISEKDGEIKNEEVVEQLEEEIKNLS